MSAEEKATITQLTLTSNIDARDFKTMRDEMPALTTLNMRDVNVVAYAGTQGTLPNDTIYNANEIPTKGFNSLSKPLIISSLILPKTVTRLCFGAIANCQKLTSLQLPEHLSVIEQGAFSAFAVESFTIPRDVTYIGPGAFMGATNLKTFEVEVGNNYFKVVDGILYDNELKRLISIPLGNKEITILQIPETVEVIDNSACYRADQLTKVIFPNILKKIETFAFGECPNLAGCIDLSGCEQLTSIGVCAFSTNKNITGFILPSSITYIGVNAFLSCTSMSKFVIKNPIPPALGMTVFSISPNINCTLYVPVGSKTLYQTTDQWKNFVNIVEFENNTVNGVKTVYLGQSGNLSALLSADEKATVTQLTLSGNIDARDFKTMRDEMPNLEEVDMMDCNIVFYEGTEGTYTYGQSELMAYPKDQVPIHAFLKHGILKKVVLPFSTISIEQEAFRLCTNLIQVEMPSNLFSISFFAFYNCQNLKSIFIGPQIQNIDDCAFSDCSATLIVDPANQYFSSIDGVLFNKDKTRLIQAPTTIAGTYQVPESVETIGHDAFLNCQQLSEVNLKENVNVIEEYAFFTNPNLKSITIFRTTPIDISSYWELVFDECIYSSCTLYVPKGSKSLYEGAEGWKEFRNIVEVDFVGVTNLKSDSFVSLSYSGNILTVNGLKHNEDWGLFTLSGQRIAGGKANLNGTIALNLPKNNIVIFKTNYCARIILCN